VSDGVTSRTAVYGPVRTVVWQGSAGNRCPYADLTDKSEVIGQGSKFRFATIRSEVKDG
jgi:hypothetical protein